MANRVFPLAKFLVAFIQVLLILRLFFKIFFSDSSSKIVTLLFSLSDLILKPFSFVRNEIIIGKSLIELRIFIAMFLVGLFGFLLLEFLRVIFPAYKKIEKDVVDEYEDKEDEQ